VPSLVTSCCAHAPCLWNLNQRSAKHICYWTVETRRNTRPEGDGDDWDEVGWE